MDSVPVNLQASAPDGRPSPAATRAGPGAAHSSPAREQVSAAAPEPRVHPDARTEPAVRTLIVQPFTSREVTALRHAVARCAAGCGLAGARLEDFVLAVHESVVNAVEHGGGYGHFRMWTAGDLLRAETSDQGSGIPESRLDSHRRPSDMAFTGRGIYLIRRLCDDVDFRTGPAGTRAVLTMRLPRHPHARPSPMRRVRVSAGAPDHLRHFTA